MKILVPTDFSVCSINALRLAALLAGKTTRGLALTHVYTPIDMASTAMVEFVEKEMVAIQQDLSKKLQQLSEEIKTDYSIEPSYSLRPGALTENILLAAKDEEADMIVMGTEGASGLTKLLFGTRTSSVIENSELPVLAVPHLSPLTLPKKIVFATNFLDGDLETLKQLLQLVRPWQPELYLLHVSHESTRSERDYIEQFSDTLTKETQYKHLYYYVLPHDNNERGIELFIKSVNADMLVLSTRKRTFIERLFSASLTKKIAFQLRVPLLAYHTSRH